MLRNATPKARRDAGPRFQRSEALEQQDMNRLSMILLRGFGVALSYSDMSRDRHYVFLKDATTKKELLDFLQKERKGEPLPGSSPVGDGPKLLALFRRAENAGLVRLEFVKAGQFTPEMGAVCNGKHK